MMSDRKINHLSGMRPPMIPNRSTLTATSCNVECVHGRKLRAGGSQTANGVSYFVK